MHPTISHRIRIISSFLDGFGTSFHGSAEDTLMGSAELSLGQCVLLQFLVWLPQMSSVQSPRWLMI